MPSSCPGSSGRDFGKTPASLSAARARCVSMEIRISAAASRSPTVSISRQRVRILPARARASAAEGNARRPFQSAHSFVHQAPRSNSARPYRTVQDR